MVVFTTSPEFTPASLRPGHPSSDKATLMDDRYDRRTTTLPRDSATVRCAW